MKVFSNSKITTYQQCPRKFKLHYIDKIPVPKGATNVEALMGTCVHSTLRDLYQKIGLEKKVTLQEVVTSFTNLWNESINSEIVIPKQGLTLEHFQQSGLAMLTKYYEHYDPFLESQTIALEKKVQFPLGEFEMTGYIDRLSIKGGSVYEIHDYKTSSAFPTMAEIENDTQLSLYQIGLYTLYHNVKKVTLHWHYVKFDHEVTVIKTLEELELTKQKTIAQIRKILHDPYYEPNETPLCHWCLYEDICPAKTHKSYLSTYSSSELDDGVQIVDEYLNILNQISDLNTKKAVLVEMASEIEKRAIEFATENKYSTLIGKKGSLQIINDWDYDFPKSTDPDRLLLENWIKNKGIWEQVSSLALTKLSKLIKNENLPNDIHNELMDFSQMIHTQKVKLIKNKIDLIKEENDVVE